MSQDIVQIRRGDRKIPADALADDGLSLADILAPLVSRWRLVLGSVAACTAIAAIVAFLLPSMYTASAMVVTPQKDQSATSMLMGQLGPLAAAAGADLGLKNPAELYVGILGSRTIADEVIRRFELKKVYNKQTQADTIAKLKNRCHFTAGRDSLIRIDVEDTDPARAAAMANLFVAKLDEENNSLTVGEAGHRREFLERQLNNEKTALETAEDAMKSTQQKTGIIEVNAQTQFAIASIAQLSAQITAGEVSLEHLKMGATPENPAVLGMQAELATMRDHLQKMEQSGDRGPLLGTSALPSNGLGYLRAMRELKYHEFLFEMLSKQYEMARLDESKAAPALQIVDVAVAPDKKSGPYRSLIVALGCLVGIIVGISIAHFQKWRLSLRSPAQPATT
jgi:tyrosine-protein kinase Etk/Wzc